jgi:hypothetical protein
MAITAGATTVMKLIPTPSIIRLMSIMPVLVLRAPIDAPTMTEPTASKPVILYPSFWKMNPAGMARMSPVKAKTDIRRPTLPTDRPKASIRRGKTGGTLN